ncbi:MAG: peptidase C26 [Acidobacteria bacterium]|nr:MAG: peptidase C26 [Acidobacteriota bacterium]
MMKTKRIGLTQRVEIIPDYGERRDALDQNWTRLLRKLGFAPVPLMNAIPSNEVGSYLNELDLSGVILTGGNDIAELEGAQDPAPERDRFEASLLDAAIERGLPILGVCRGMQVVNLHEGGNLVRIDGHAGARHRVEWDGRILEVNSYHNFGIGGLGDGLVATARSDDRSIEAFRHNARAIEGVMWHPEREKPFQEEDLSLLAKLFGAEPNS